VHDAGQITEASLSGCGRSTQDLEGGGGGRGNFSEPAMRAAQHPLSLHRSGLSDTASRLKSARVLTESVLIVSCGSCSTAWVFRTLWNASRSIGKVTPRG